MTVYSSKCSQCDQICDWIKHPEGGWWMHRAWDDGHRIQIDWQPMEHQDDNGNWVTM